MIKEKFKNSWNQALEEVRQKFNNPLISDTLLTPEQEEIFLKKFASLVKQLGEEVDIEKEQNPL